MKAKTTDTARPRSTTSIDDFALETAKSSGGVTGSKRVLRRSNNSSYQLKPSILDNTYTRQLKAKRTERENFGEFISSCIGRSMLASFDKPSTTLPEIILVYDQHKKRALIASKYLEGNVVQTLDDYAQAIAPGPAPLKGKKKGHASFVPGQLSDSGKIGLDSNQMVELKSSLRDSIGISAVLGDHDVNPGNMMVVTNLFIDEETDEIVQQSQIARIDLGHAFNDLLNVPVAPSLFGAALDTAHPVQDFLNREKVAGFGGGDPSKFWRDYPGMGSLSEMAEMAETFERIGSVPEEAIKKGVEDAKQGFLDLLRDMKANNDDAGIAHVHSSLVEIYNNISSEKMQESPQQIRSQIDTIFEEYGNFVINNCKDALRTSKLLTIQSTIDQQLKNRVPMDQIYAKVLPIFNNLEPNANQSDPNKKITWVKEGPDVPPFSGTLKQYLIQRQIDLLYKQEPNKPVNKIANSILNYLNSYQTYVDSQRIGNSTGIQKAGQLETGLYEIAEQLAKNNPRGALDLVKVLRTELITKFGETNLIGKSNAIQAVTQMQADLKKIVFNEYKQGMAQMRLHNEPKPTPSPDL
ncbi:hypothetical protein BN59_02820 [Legionella massiliensis]|uniref:LepB N-terminal domain-containing protein n=1 Tax=Legionella massiliensis TaxID=1034943 RepID=A0A078KVQ7_9GAMM|nr:hypothetical protein [Legionella massiliensis]CDZ78510.1 hypothetical protein BN59_02820 [Legionella massiliensis]CEE14248.1 hypothetical protein BN1094_02820 [Legionella massiliensis]